MAIYQFEAVAGTTITFDPAVDTLNFAATTGSAADLDFLQNGTSLRVRVGDQYVDLAFTALPSLGDGDFTFDDGSVFRIGTSGNDALSGTANHDLLWGGDGGTDTLTGGAGDDHYIVGSGDVVVELADGGIDTVRTNLSGYALGANVENAAIYSETGSVIYGNALDNTIFSGMGNDTINGGSGTDIANYQLATGGVNVWLAQAGAQDTGWGMDTLINIENLAGSNYDDELRGNSLANVLNGAAGNDTLNGGAGYDTLMGGIGNDFYVLDSSGDVIVEEAGEGTDTIISALTGTALQANVENIILNQTLDSNAYGNSLDNVFYAGNGNNIINGGTGTDTVSYNYATSAVNVWLALSGAQGTGGSGADTLTNIENLNGSAYNDTLRGNALVNRLSGGDGDDTLDGGGGADVLIGGLGSDTYYVDAGDIVVEQVQAANGGGIDTVITAQASYTLGANLENLVLSGSGAQNGYGNVLDNTIYAGDGNNVMNGFSGSDTVNYFNADAGVTIDLGLTTAQNTGGSGIDTLLDLENLTGSTYADMLTGSAGDNIINGASGNDTIIGGAGSDELTGGAGADVFRYLSPEDSGAAEALRDLIIDFAAEDVIDLSALDANTAVDGDQGFTFIGSADFSATDASGQLRYDAVLGVIYGSNDADADAEFSIALAGMPALTAEDFML